ncbi:MAG: glycosyltransferase [Candidatus Caenarcaniphilales bacterium]|nr:glycosyltransferase [Candidatus Caenarcaniphilales bacterium]
MKIVFPIVEKFILVIGILVVLNYFCALLGYKEILISIIILWNELRSFYTVGGNSFLYLLTPLIISLCITFSIIFLFPKPRFILKLIIGLMVIYLGCQYILWRLLNTLALDNLIEGIISISVYISELIIMTDFLISSYLLNLKATNLTPEANILEQDVLSGKFTPTVDILIPTYNESVEILRKTIIGCQAINYPNKKIYLLDDTRRDEAKTLTEQLGCYYITRPNNDHAKAGNINNALNLIDSEFIAIFDADFIPSKNFLSRTIGFFQDKNTALLQTPQNFYNADPIEKNLNIKENITNEQDLFFRHIQPCRDTANAIICCGTCYVIRRSALDEIGGIPTESITEDILTSIRLEIRGYRLRYLNEALSAGEAPGNIGAYIDQRLRWGQGTIQCLFTDSNPLLVKGLNWLQKIYFSSSISYWFISIPRLILLIAPCFYLLFGINPLRATVEGLAFYFLPYFTVNLLIANWFNGGKRSPLWSNVYEMILCYPMAITAINSLINPFGKGFKVTPKGIESSQVEANWKIIKPLIILVGLYAVGILITFQTFAISNNKEPLIINTFWAVYNATVCWISILCALDIPSPGHVEFPHKLNGKIKLKVNNDCIPVQSLNISDKDIVLKPLNDSPFISHEKKVLSYKLDLVEAGIENVEIEFAKKIGKSNYAKFQYTNIGDVQYRKLIEFLYCRPGQWEEKTISEVKSSFSFLHSIFNMNPLVHDHE